MIGNDLALVDVQRDPEERLEVAVGLIERFDLEQAHSSSTPMYTACTSRLAITSAGMPSVRIAAEVDRDQPVDDREERVDDVLDPDDRRSARPEIPDRLDQLVDLGLDQPTGDLVEQTAAVGCVASARASSRRLRCNNVSEPARTLGRSSRRARSRISITVRVRVGARSRLLPNRTPTSTFSNTVSRSNGCGIWMRAGDPGAAPPVRGHPRDVRPVER